MPICEKASSIAQFSGKVLQLLYIWNVDFYNYVVFGRADFLSLKLTFAHFQAHENFICAKAFIPRGKN